MEQMWAAHDRELTPESYMDEYITAEIPQLPDERDNSPAANAQRDYHNFVITRLYHTCSEKHCKTPGKATCQKRFPVIPQHQNINIIFLLMQKPYSQLNIERKNRTPLYRRRPAPKIGETFDPVVHGYEAYVPGDKKPRTNQYVVPHNRFLTMKYKSQ